MIIQTPPYVTLDMPALPEQQNWNIQAGSTDFMQAMLSSTGDPSIFQVSFDPSALTNEPPEGFEISYAQVEDPSTSNAWPSSFEQQQAYQMYNQQEQTYQEPQQQQRIVSDEITPQQHAEMMSYINFNYQEDAYAPNVASSSRVSSTSSVPASTSAYVPPTGAYTGRRVVAGSWKPPIHYDDDSPPRSPIQAANHWSLQAIS